MRKNMKKTLACVLAGAMVLSGSITSFAATTDPSVSERETRNAALSMRAASEGMVLLENQNNALPLHTKKIALYGGGAQATVKGGTGSGDVNSRHVVTVREAMEEAGYDIVTRDWLDAWQVLQDDAPQSSILGAQPLADDIALTDDDIAAVADAGSTPSSMSLEGRPANSRTAPSQAATIS
ncbi:glycoside hydrolase family 3 C-terminal domain-containing protein [Candidatus Soleaferrea massiliensis]|uniref:glycoside hydrolase family 3 C-terminal domain-containing protein n=1 Tax=Candidatus Soleaferrea massiliensis TaxID=1470354 RepID=UPI0018CEE6AD|nr:glycoside hydrolase family 3 C-terminal domain-containing protein [Candidatus Soleaferrea massiliensis]